MMPKRVDKLSGLAPNTTFHLSEFIFIQDGKKVLKPNVVNTTRGDPLQIHSQQQMNTVTIPIH